MNLENKKLEIKEFFSDLTFEEESHKYFINFEPLKYSVSGLVHRFENPFDSDRVAGFVAKSRGLEKEDILNEWQEINKESTDRGSRVHLFGENFMFDRNLNYSCPQEEAITKFWNDLPDYIVPVFSELQCYHKEYMYGGTIDIVLFNTKTGEFILADYKTNKDLFKNYKGQKLKGPFSDLLDTPLNKYKIQLNYYKQLLEQIEGVKVSRMKIIWLKLDGNYELFDCEDYSDRIEKKVKNNLKWL